MKEPPKGWPRISSAIFYDDAPAAIDWLCEAFGFEVRLKVEGEGGTVIHSELTFGEAVVMVASADETTASHGGPYKSPRQLNGANTQSLFAYVDDVDAHCERAKAAGATVLQEPQVTDYGEEHWADRNCQVEDPEGHRWWFAQRVRDPGQRAG